MGISVAASFFLIVLIQYTDSFSGSLIRASRPNSIHRIQWLRTALSVADQDTEPAKKRGTRSKIQKTHAVSNKPNKVGQSWRIFGVTVHPDHLVGDDASDYLAPAVVQALCRRLKINEPPTATTLPDELSQVRVVRRSLDARKTKVSDGPRFAYVLDVIVKPGSRLKIKPVSGRQELLNADGTDSPTPELTAPDGNESSSQKPTVIIVGAGPAGLFCALTLAQSGNVKPIILERGQAVESRGKDIGGLMHRSFLNTESNFCFGEGGAGTFSDGKLTTRIGRNSESVRYVLETLVQFGAPSSILLDGAPHLGTDNLVRLMRNMRQSLRNLGGEVYFGAKVDKLLHENGRVQGVEVSYSPAIERGRGGLRQGREDFKKDTLHADAIVLATGHSARDFYESLHEGGVQLEAKGFAAGFRVEHPQRLINEIQYGSEWGPSVVTGKVLTDAANREHFSELGDSDSSHSGRLPVPSYRLATDKAFDGSQNRGAYSFCMCPGGQIVPASTNPNELCVNGMSFSKRDSLWANSALVVTVAADDPVLDPYREEHGVLAGIAFQRDMEKRASIMGGGNLTVPVQRLTDFVAGRASESAPSSSYRLGVKPSACHEIYPASMTAALRDAIVNHFDKSLPGFLCEDGLLHAVETRTSSPVRISRDPATLQAIGIGGLYPAGEGAGFAGGIVSAAVDGIVVADAVLNELVGTSGDGTYEWRMNSKSVGFSY
ncbi:5-formyltetrahydrofolate cyclo-ligase [Fragilaria crotonensis]|nr:5-formyltetrahydrofolate cyclo-ligase [Fragilaria crotonensis]